MGVRVAHKSGDDIIRTISENVSRMLSRKMDAVKCLFKEAEKLSEEWKEPYVRNFTYYSAKYSNVTIEDRFIMSNVPKNMQENNNETYTFGNKTYM